MDYPDDTQPANSLFRAKPRKEKSSSDQQSDNYLWTANTNKSQFHSVDQLTVPNLPPGYYTYSYAEIGICFFKIVIRKDPVLDICPDQQKLLLEMHKFWESKSRYAKLKVSYKRGILLHGPQGGGKSTAVRRAIDIVLAKGGYALKYLEYSSDLFFRTISAIRLREGDVPIVVILEDIDNSISGEDEDTDLLEVLDGTSEVSNLLFIATTNYLDKLPLRIKDRPGRFDTLLEIGLPNEEVRRNFVKYFLNVGDSDPIVKKYSMDERVVEKSLAHLKEFVIFSEIYK